MPILPGTGSYHNPRGFGVSDALKRARSPHRFGNIFIGMALTGFIISVYSYSISAVKQDDFSDVVLANSPVQTTPQE
ncbi:protein of unknown function [Taphrina deformans PYCC 5710]|uniref:Cytochrome c oxidase assembly factor 3 n=1 Tax=Taphrina deformans (strain PYCC 5710 / ATCC 11124 / CBS 356.35 / IMI 108563 / JCM 9778 / NBRC 8474) TaxID=1097556 RepID=R4XBF2_TAPDE|nr:protein of unknown function [Taphrina deformans PYCC 5710]|eukprot:CCG81696.1 protein of unknown function [Taphrina deformans PYCC 5710]